MYCLFTTVVFFQTFVFLAVLEIIFSFALYTYFIVLLRSYIHKIKKKYKGNPPRPPFKQKNTPTRGETPLHKDPNSQQIVNISTNSSPSKSAKSPSNSGRCFFLSVVKNFPLLINI